MNKYESIKDENLFKVIAEKEIMSFREALIYLDVSRSFLYKLNSKKAIPYTKPNNGKVYYKRKDLDEWMLRSETSFKNKLEEQMLSHLKSNAK